jgi:hypothetical protein
VKSFSTVESKKTRFQVVAGSASLRRQSVCVTTKDEIRINQVNVTKGKVHDSYDSLLVVDVLELGILYIILA